jgi:hypothetical protein
MAEKYVGPNFPAAFTREDILAMEQVQNTDSVRENQPLGLDQNTIVTDQYGEWPNVTFTLDNSGGLTDKLYLLMDPTAYINVIAADNCEYTAGGIGQFIGTLDTDYFMPDSMSPNLTWQMLNNYGARVNLAIESLKLQTSSDSAQFDAPFELVYGMPGNFKRRDISENIEFLQSPRNYSELLLKGRVTPMIPMDILNAPLVTVIAGEIYRVTASFKAIYGLPVAGRSAIPYPGVRM